MDIQLNGKRTLVANGITIDELIRIKGLDPATVVVERNRSIIATDDWGQVNLQEDDDIEILRFVGGG